MDDDDDDSGAAVSGLVTVICIYTSSDLEYPRKLHMCQ